VRSVTQALQLNAKLTFYRYEFDFYLQAHAGLKGTVRPTHYTVVYDENSLGADEIQQGTNAASYLYGRATKAVSIRLLCISMALTRYL
jgi:hypothetical protein